MIQAPFVDAPIGDINFVPTMEYFSHNLFSHPHTFEPIILGIQQTEGAVVPLIPRTPGQRVCQPIHQAARSGNLDMIKLLLEKDFSCASVPDEHGVTAIWAAAYYGHLEAVRLLLKCCGVDINAAATEYMRTPIQQAAQNGHVEVVKILLEAGVQVDPHMDSYDIEMPSPLWLAAQGGHVELVELLIRKGAYVNFSVHPSKRLPIHAATEDGHTETVHLLIINGADIDAREEDGWSPLAIAANQNHIGVVNLLLEHNANVNAEGEDGVTALWLASQEGHVQVIQELLDKGAKSIATRSDQRRPIHQAARFGHLEAVKLLLKHDPGDSNIADGTGSTPLLLASRGETASHVEVARYLIEHGASIVLGT